VSDPWTTPDGLAALRAGDFGAIIRAYRKHTGLSQTAVAGKTGLAQSDVSPIENGLRRVLSASVQKRILDGLGVPIHLRDITSVTAPETKGSKAGVDYDETQALELSQRVGASDVGAATLGLLRSAFDDLACAYSTTTPKRLVERLRVHLAYVSRLLGARMTLAEHRELLVLGGWFSLLAATVHVDLRQNAAASARLRTASELAEHVGHAEIQAWSLETRAWRALTEGHYRQAVQLSRTAQAVAPAGTSVLVQATSQEGKASARLGDRRAVFDSMDRVRALVADHPIPDQPGHHYMYDPAKFTAYSATTLAWLGDLEGEPYARELIARLTEAEESWPRRIASAHLDLSLILLRNDRLDEAASEASAALASGHVAPSNFWRASEVVTVAESVRLPEAADLRESFEALRKRR
jgi:transcriptional regulator with XRE-family HTH domain